MGNDQSYMSGLELDQKAKEVTDYFAHYSASLNSVHQKHLSVFVGERLVGGSLWVSQTPLEKASKNLMIYRHPCILKYVSSWGKGSKFFLAVEDVKPLSHILPTLSGLQICIGLHSVLKALCFLHEKALVSHNNVCIASIYVTRDGSWKLGGTEYLCPFKELTSDYIAKTQTSRYDKAIDSNEIKYLKQENCRKDFIDVYAFGVLAAEVLKAVTEDQIPSVTNFCNFCKNDLQNVNISFRPKLVSVLDSPFFNHDFITIYSFLVELPLKSDEEKAQFFSVLPEKLSCFSEVAVGSQLGSLLLSRLVLLNKTAQKVLLPLILCPRQGEHENSIFSVENFKNYIAPKLLEIFCVRDAEIRKLLLKHFINYLGCFSNQELQSDVLPELLVGIKDTNDELVALTLQSLANLVPVLGSSTVIGGKRAKLFTDGRPDAHSNKQKKQRAIHPVTQPSPARVISETSTASLTNPNLLDLPERPQPDGEEVDTSTEEVEQSADDDLEAWEDWDANETSGVNHSEQSLLPSCGVLSETEPINIIEAEPLEGVNLRNQRFDVLRKKSLPDITELDIKNQRNSGRDVDDIDFFQDMEPVIGSTSRFVIKDEVFKEGGSEKSLNLNVVGNADDTEDGWGEEDWA